MQFSSRLPLFLGLSAAFVPAYVVGCGGGGGGNGPSTPQATATPRPTPTPTPTASGTCNASSYTPNYVADLDSLQHWPGFPLRIYLAPTDARTRALTIRGFNQWVAATNKGVRYTLINNADAADITVAFDQITTGDTLGVTTTYFFDGDTTIQKAEIQFYYYAFDARSDAEAINQSVAAHEFGHALGIQGHSTNDNDLMFPRATGGLEAVTTRDLNTLRTAYCNTFPTRSSNAIRRQSGVLRSHTISFRR